MTPTLRDGQHVAVLADDPGLQPLQRATERGQSPGFTPGRRDGSVQHGEQVGVDFVDGQSAAALGERHRHRRLGHAVGGHHGFRAQPERRGGLAQVLDVGWVNLLCARERPAQRGQVELAGLSLPAQAFGEHRVGEVGRRCHGALVLVDEPCPQQGVAKEVHRRDLDQLDAEVHRHRQVAGHAHVVEARQPAHDHVGFPVDVCADEHRLSIRDDVAMADLDRLGRSGRAGRQLQQRNVVVFGVDGVDRPAVE